MWQNWECRAQKIKTYIHAAVQCNGWRKELGPKDFGTSDYTCRKLIKLDAWTVYLKDSLQKKKGSYIGRVDKNETWCGKLFPHLRSGKTYTSSDPETLKENLDHFNTTKLKILYHKRWRTAPENLFTAHIKKLCQYPNRWLEKLVMKRQKL